MALSTKLRQLPGPHVTIALGDGVGALNTLEDGVSVGETISRFAPDAGAVTLVLGWSPVLPSGLTPDVFSRIVTLMPGWGMRKLLPHSVTRSAPTSMAGTPALLVGHLRPDVLITRMTRSGDGLQFCTEVSWQQALVDAGVALWTVLDDDAPTASAQTPVGLDAVTVVGRGGDPTDETHSCPTDSVDLRGQVNAEGVAEKVA